MRERPAGRSAVLLDFEATPAPKAAAADAAAALAAALADGALPGVEDLVPAATTILVQGSSTDGVDRLALRRALRGSAGMQTEVDDDDEVIIGVHYDGPDLHDVALHLGWTTGAVVASHTSTRCTWRTSTLRGGDGSR